MSQQKNDGESTNKEDEEGIIDWAAMDLLPSRRYVHRLIQRYTSHLEECNIELEDDNLASLVCHFSMSRCISNFPDPTSYSCTATYKIPPFSKKKDHYNDDNTTSASKQKTGINIRTYPHHNDVGVAKAWEAGACLAEYIIQNPHRICDRNVVELGAGVGLTGLVAAGFAKAKSVHMTDYTEVCLDNLAYNVCDNRDWLVERGICPETVTVGKLEWGDYSKGQTENETMIDTNGCARGTPWANSIEALSTADVLLAADVVYDISCFPDLVGTVYKFLSGQTKTPKNHSRERVAIFATTYRNKNTFGLFERELEEKNIICVYDHSINDLPNIFPCYFNQPRTDVRVCTMKIMNQ
ncbi:hypothetical protein ACHAXR_001403 [Thalassiosira sp. AJA248-18]